MSFIVAMVQHYFCLSGRVLCVEYSPTSARVTGDLLRSYGLHVVATPDVAQAMRLLRAAALPEAEPFNLVLTNYYLAGKQTGRDLVSAIRTELYYSPQTLPVLVITGESSEQVLTEVLEAGSNDFVTKPIIPAQFMVRAACCSSGINIWRCGGCKGGHDLPRSQQPVI